MSLNKQKFNSNIDDERIILSKSISGNASKNISYMTISNNISVNDSNGKFLKHDDKLSVFDKLNKRDTSNAGLLQKSFSKSFKEDESIIHDDEHEEAEKEIERGDILRDDKSRRLVKKEKICDTDTEDEGSDAEKDQKWVFLPDDRFKKGWDSLIAILILYSAIVIPYKIAFVDIDATVQIDMTCDVIFAFDILINFYSAYNDDEDNLVKNRKKIRSTYMRSWLAIDVISILPISYFTDSTFKYNNLTRLGRLPKLYRLLKLTKLIRMSKMAKKGNVNRFTKFFLEKLKVNANIERLIYFILSFLLLNHLSACIWYFVAKLQDLSPDCWVTRLGYIDASNFEIYVISFYWTLTTVTTVGYGDINAGTTVERAYNLIIMSFGVLMYSFAIGSLSSIVSTLDAKTAEMNQKLQILSSIKKEFNLDQDIYDKVRKVIKYDLSRNQKDKMNFLQELPNKLRIELSQIMHDKVIQNLYFFRDQPSDFIAYVAPLLKPVKFSQNDYLYKTGDMIDEMYFVSKGTVILCLGKEYNEREIKEIKKNNNFGEIEMCLNEKLTFNIKIKSRNCELFVLKKNDFLRLSVNFKEFIENFLHKSLMIYLKFNEEKKKIIREEEMKMTKNGIDKLKHQNEKNNLEIVDEEKDDESEYELNSDFESEEKSNITDQEENDDVSKLNSNNILTNLPSQSLINNPNLLQGEKENNDTHSNIIRNIRIDDDKSKYNPVNDPKKGVQENNSIMSEADDPIDKMKNQINKKFIKKIDRILDYLDKNNINFDNTENNPRLLLKQLKLEANILEKNHIIDTIENILKEFYNKNSIKDNK